ncbi:MAG: hypothetical protein ABSE59_11245, partial [Opitutaceae bacterium]
MNSSFPSSRSLRSRGSALLTVMIFTFVMALLLASILGWSITEYRFNVRTAYLIEAHNAAEAVSEYGAAQVEYLASNISPTPSMDPASGQTVDFQHNPLQLPFVV